MRTSNLLLDKLEFTGEGLAMKKGFFHKLMFVVSALLVLIFAAYLLIDYNRYYTMLNSAPFSVWVLVRAIEFVIPAAIVFAIGCVLKKKGK